MEQSTSEGSIRQPSLGKHLKDPSQELGSIKWHEFTAVADGQIPAHTLTHAYNALRNVSRYFENNDQYYPSEPDEEPYFTKTDSTRANTVIDLDRLYSALRLGKMEQAHGGCGMGTGTIGLVTDLINAEIESQTQA